MEINELFYKISHRNVNHGYFHLNRNQVSLYIIFEKKPQLSK